jgi:hypothetical protein
VPARCQQLCAGTATEKELSLTVRIAAVDKLDRFDETTVSSIVHASRSLLHLIRLRRVPY